MSPLPVHRCFTLVGPNSEEVSSYTPAIGEILRVAVCYGESGNSPDTVAVVVWDEAGDNVVLYSTHQSGIDDRVGFVVTGDGIKKLDVKLINSSDTAVHLGAGWAS